MRSCVGDPLPAELDRRAVGQLMVEHAAAHAITGFEDHDVLAGGEKVACRDQPRDAGADDGDVGFHSLRHGCQRT